MTSCIRGQRGSGGRIPGELSRKILTTGPGEGASMGLRGGAIEANEPGRTDGPSAPPRIAVHSWIGTIGPEVRHRISLVPSGAATPPKTPVKSGTVRAVLTKCSSHRELPPLQARPIQRPAVALAAMESTAGVNGWSDCLSAPMRLPRPARVRRQSDPTGLWDGRNATNCLGMAPGIPRRPPGGRNSLTKRSDAPLFSLSPVNCHCRSPMVSRF